MSTGDNTKIIKITDGFILREIAGTWVVIPVGAKIVDFSGIVNLSESGALLWEKLEKGASEQDLVEAVMGEYHVDELDAESDVQEFLADMKAQGLVE